mgnify:FL=1
MVLKVTCCPGWPGYGSSGLYFFPGLFFTFFLIFSHLWWFGVLGFGSWIGFLGLGFSVDGVLGLWCEAIRGFWGWGSLYKHIRINLGKKLCVQWVGRQDKQLETAQLERITSKQSVWTTISLYPGSLGSSLLTTAVYRSCWGFIRLCIFWLIA